MIKPEYYKMGTSNHRGYANLEINGNSMEEIILMILLIIKNWGKLNLKKLLNHKCIERYTNHTF